MTYSDSVWTGQGWIGRVCADVECATILHETTDAYSDAEQAGYVAWLEWGRIVDDQAEGHKAEEAA